MWLCVPSLSANETSVHTNESIPGFRVERVDPRELLVDAISGDEPGSPAKQGQMAHVRPSGFACDAPLAGFILHLRASEGCVMEDAMHKVVDEERAYEVKIPPGLVATRTRASVDSSIG